MTRYQFIDDSGETRLAGTLEPDPGGSSPLLSSTVPLSSSDILALHTTPVTLVEGVADVFLLPVLIVAVLTPGATDYSTTGLLRVFNGPTWAIADRGVGGLDSAWLEWDDSALAILAVQGAPPVLVLISEGYGLLGGGGEVGNASGQPLCLDATAANQDGDGTAVITTYYIAQSLT